MRESELTVVLSGETTSAKKKQTKEFIEKLVKTGKGSIAKFDDWGKIDLAYEIKRESEGVFLHFTLELSPESANNIKSKLNLKEEIIRYLLVRVE